MKEYGLHDLASLFDSPTQPVFSELELLNAENDSGFVYIMEDRPDSDDLKPKYAIPVELIKNPDLLLPGFREQFADDCKVGSYSSNNTFWYREGTYSRDAELKGIVDHKGKPLYKPSVKGQRTVSMLRFLNACWADLDIYKAGITQGQTLAHVWDLMEQGKIPPVSWIKNSGRGLWLFWALKQTRAFSVNEFDTIPTWERIQRQIELMFKRYESDSQAKDGARVSRVHGSINPKSNSPVSLMVLYGHDGQIPRYDLADLEQFFETYPRRYSPELIDSSTLYQCLPEDQPDRIEYPSPSRYKIGVLGRSTRYTLDLTRFWALVETVRSKRITKGNRNSHAKVLGIILRHSLNNLKATDDEKKEAIEAAASRLYDSFEDPSTYCFDNLRKQLHSGVFPNRNRYTEHEANQANPKHRWIADELKLTTLESLQLSTLVHSKRKDRYWPPMTGQIDQRIKKASRPKQAETRRKYIADSYKPSQRPPYKILAGRIEQATGLDCSPMTARADWQAVFPPDPTHRQIDLFERDPTEPQETKGTESQNS